MTSHPTRPSSAPDPSHHTKKRKKRSVSQTIDQVMTIKTSTGSSKTELSSRGKRPFKVFGFSRFFATDGTSLLGKIHVNNISKGLGHFLHHSYHSLPMPPSVSRSCRRRFLNFWPYLSYVLAIYGQGEVLFLFTDARDGTGGGRVGGRMSRASMKKNKK